MKIGKILSVERKKPKKTFDSDDDENCLCIYCLNPYSESRSGEQWVQCAEYIRGGALVLTSYRKLGNQFVAQLIKRFHYSKRHWSVLIAQLAIPLLLMCLCMYSIKSSISQYRTEYDPLKMDISSVYGKTDGFYYSERPNLSGLADSLKNVLNSNKVSVQKVPEPTHFVLNYGKDITKYYKKIVVGGAIDRDPTGALNLTAWYNDQMFHSMPMALLVMHTALLQNTVNGGSISLTNAPLPELQSGYSIDIGGKLMVIIMATVFVPLALGFLSASFTLVPIHERATKAKLLQLMSGIPAVMYWTAMFLWDYLVHCIACIFMIIPYAIFAHYAFFGKHSISTGTSLLLMFLYGWSSIPFSYLASFVFSKGNAGFASVVGFCAAAGVGAGSTFKAMLSTSNISEKVRNDLKIATWFLRIFPTFSLGTGFSNLFVITYGNSICESLPPEDLNMTCKSPLMTSESAFFKCCK
ncbi:ATP-binding cassette sub-family A member 17, partial [Araneus ventricosus]